LSVDILDFVGDAYFLLLSLLKLGCLGIDRFFEVIELLLPLVFLSAYVVLAFVL